MIAIQDLLSILMLWCAMQQLNVCMFVMFQLFTIYPLIILGVSMGTLIQHGENPFEFRTYQLLQFLVCVVNIPVYIYGNFVVFQTYKEVKACLRGLGDITGAGREALNVNGGNEMVGGGQSTIVQGGGNLAKGEVVEKFQGKGVTLG